MTAEDSAIEALVRHTVATALTLPCREATKLLKGLLILGGEHPALELVRVAYHGLHTSEQQLELLAKQ